MQLSLPLYSSEEEQRIIAPLDRVEQALQDVQSEFDTAKEQGNTERVLVLADHILEYNDIQVDASFLFMDVERKRLKLRER